MWERFSSFGLRTLMVLFFIQELQWTDSQAYLIFGAYLTFSNITPLFGGYLCDKVWGHRITTIAGGCFVTIGHLCLALLPSLAFLFGIACIIVGTGLVVPSLCSLVGQLYQNDKPRHDRAYNLFYMGINFGGILAALIVGLVASHYGWHFGFGLAALGMIIALVIFIRGWNDIASVTPNNVLLNPLSKIHNIMIIISLFLSIGLITYILNQPYLIPWIASLILLSTITIFIRLFRYSNYQTRKNLLLLIFLNILSLCFFVMFEQTGTSINLFTERVIDRHLFNLLIPTTALFSLNPIFIIALAPLMSFLWKFLSDHGLSLTATSKIGLGLILSAGGFFTLALAAHSSNPPLIWLIGAVLQMTIGELCIAPVVLAAISEYAPNGAKSTLMGAWFMSSAIAGYLSSLVAKLTSISSAAMDLHSTYGQIFASVGNYGFIIGMSTLASAYFYKKWLHR
jgi:POT family proton-dependent oligopeptide transporter